MYIYIIFYFFLFYIFYLKFFLYFLSISLQCIQYNLLFWFGFTNLKYQFSSFIYLVLSILCCIFYLEFFIDFFFRFVLVYSVRLTIMVWSSFYQFYEHSFFILKNIHNISDIYSVNIPFKGPK